MKIFKGTQGNWKIGKNSDTVISDNIEQITEKDKKLGHSEVEYYGGLLICESVRNKKDSQLIASAPELLKVLIGVLNIINDSTGVQGYHLNGEVAEWDEFEEIKEIETAIQKAIG